MRDEVCCLAVGMTAIHCEKGFCVGGQLLAGSFRQTPHARMITFRSLQSSNSWTCWGYSGTKASRLTHSTCWKKPCLTSWLCCLLRSLTWTCFIHMVQAVRSNIRVDSITPPQVWVATHGCVFSIDWPTSYIMNLDVQTCFAVMKN